MRWKYVFELRQEWGRRVNKIRESGKRVNLKNLGYICCFAFILGIYEKTPIIKLFFKNEFKVGWLLAQNKIFRTEGPNQSSQ